jgi:hypothetical protein
VSTLMALVFSLAMDTLVGVHIDNFAYRDNLIQVEWLRRGGANHVPRFFVSDYNLNPCSRSRFANSS